VVVSSSGAREVSESGFIGNAMKILIIEDEKDVATYVAKALKEHGYAVEVARDGRQGIEKATSQDYDLVVLDMMLPRADGWEVLGAIRKSGKDTRVLVLTALDSTSDKVRALDRGADDYLVKPFAGAELTARVRALLRRSKGETTTELTYADIKMDLVKRRVTRGDRDVELTNREFALLEYFLRNAEQALTRAMLVQHVWGYQFDPMTNLVDVYINYLRTKMDMEGPVKLIHTVRGAGYMLSKEAVE
jgi:DNA-binding response OmpR family regulator